RWRARAHRSWRLMAEDPGPAVQPVADVAPLTVRDLLARCAATTLGDLTLVAGGAGIDRVITHASLQKTGLALAGLPDYLEDGRVLLFGRSEVQYLAALEAGERRRRLRDVLRPGLPCVVVAAGLEVDEVLADEANRHGVPVLATSVLTSSA